MMSGPGRNSLPLGVPNQVANLSLNLFTHRRSVISHVNCYVDDWKSFLEDSKVTDDDIDVLVEGMTKLSSNERSIINKM